MIYQSTLSRVVFFIPLYPVVRVFDQIGASVYSEDAAGDFYPFDSSLDKRNCSLDCCVLCIGVGFQSSTDLSSFCSSTQHAPNSCTDSFIPLI